MPKGKATPLALTAEERSELEKLVRRRKTAQDLALRARIVLCCAAGATNQAVAREVGVCAHTVGKWRERFAEHRLDGLRDGPRSGAPRTVTDERVAELLARTLETMPEGATHWSTRSMAAACGLSPATVQRVWHALGLKPHRVESSRFSADPAFVEKVRDIVGLYLAPPDRALVLCVDEKTEMQAIERTQAVLPMRPGQAERRASDYRRHGASPLFAALDVAAGKVIGRCYRRHRAEEFRDFLDAVDAAVPVGLGSRCTWSWTGARGLGQRRDPQGAGGQGVAARAAPLPAPLHPDRQLVAQPGRALLRAAHGGAAAQAGRAPLGRGSRGGGAGLRRARQRRAQALPLDRSADQILAAVGRACERTLAVHGSELQRTQKTDH